MNKIANLGVLPAIAALVFFLITCSNPEPQIDPPNKIEGESSSSDGTVVGPGSSATSSTTQVSSNSNISSSRSSSSAVASSSSAGSGSSSSVAVSPPILKDDIKETVGGVTFDMIYIPGGTFTIGCEKESGECPSDTKPVAGVKVSNYYIGKTEITTGLWKAVMGSDGVPSYSK